LPIDPEEFFVDLSAVPVSAAELAIPACSNCGARDVALASCAAGHALCADCEVRCSTCAGLLCLSCGAMICPACQAAPVAEVLTPQPA
jgi:hypothetical protein